MVAIELIGPKGKRIVDAALIDTGADRSAFPLSWLRQLGIFKKDCRPSEFVSAAGTGTQLRYKPGVRAVIFGHEIPLQAIFVNTPVALLGREDFLKEFEVTFDQRNDRFVIASY